MTSVLPEGSMSVKERRQLLLQKGLAIAGGGETQEQPNKTFNSNTNQTKQRSSSIKASAPPLAPSNTESSTTLNNHTNNNLHNDSFSSIKDRIKLLDNKTTSVPSLSTNQQQLMSNQLIPSTTMVNIPQPPPSLSSSSALPTTTPTIQSQQQPYIPPPPSSLFSFDKIRELHRDEYEEFEYQLKQTELELDSNSNQLLEDDTHNNEEEEHYTIVPTSLDEQIPKGFQLNDGKNWKNLIQTSSSPPIDYTNNYTNNNIKNNSIGKERVLPPTSSNRNNQINNNMVISNNNMMMKERMSVSSSSSTPITTSPPLTNSAINNNIGINVSNNIQSSPINAIYHYPIKVQTTSNNNNKSDEVQYPSAPSFEDIDFPEYQIVNNVQMQTMTSNIFKPITDSISEVSEEEDYRMFSQFKEFITSQHGPALNEEKLYSLYISFRERYQQQAHQTNVNNIKQQQQSPTVLLVNKSRVPTSGIATKAKPIVNPNSPTVSTTSGGSTSSSGSSNEKKRDGLRDVRKKYEEQKLEEMRIKQMKERNKAHYAQEMQQPCMDYNALLMRENAMYNVPSNTPVGGVNSYPTINNPNDVISNGTYVPFKASHPQQSNSHITSRLINNSTSGGSYLNYNNNNYWPNNNK